MKQRTRAARLSLALLASASVPLLAAEVATLHGADSQQDTAGGAVRFRDVAADAGISYRRVKSPRDDISAAIKARGVVNPMEQPFFAMKPHGAPGVAIMDYDNDGDQDFFVPNGPGVAHSLYKNLLRETGSMRFTDVAAAAGVAAPEHDGSGACYADTDNDGDQDLLALGTNGNRFFLNQGDGTFVDATEAAGFGGTQLGAASCSFGDVNGDALLDVVIGNSFDWSSWIPMMVVPFDLNHQEQLFVNQGGNRFVDRAAQAGIANFSDITWAIAMVDYDQDGDVDIVEATDQAPIPPLEYGGIDRGYIRLYRNDGSGVFEDVTAGSGLDTWGFWMGLSFADFNADGHLDVLASNIGSYSMRLLPIPHSVADDNSNTKWFFGSANGTFTEPGLGEIKATPFGWGNAAFDYDNDGDADIAFYGGFEMPLIAETSNPGALLANDGRGNFTRDAGALMLKHNRRDVKGLAVGDLNNDGFMDIISVAAAQVPEALPLLPLPVTFGGPFDGEAVFAPTWVPREDGLFSWSGVDVADGNIVVEMNSGNSNRSVSLHLQGSAGLISGGKVNRDGIGAMAKITLRNGRQMTSPVLGGSSYASQNSLDVSFGMGAGEQRATVEVLWPGGVRNRLYNVKASERIVFPEIPCSFDAGSFKSYFSCVTRAVRELGAVGTLSARDQARFLSSALRAFHEERR